MKYLKINKYSTPIF